jgi:hypothetical protein
MLDLEALATKVGAYRIGDVTALDNRSVLQRVQTYRRRFGGIAQLVDARDMNRRVPSGSYEVSRKYDGEFTAIRVMGGQAFTINLGGTVRHGFGALEEAAALTTRAGLEDVTFAAELYVDKGGARERVHDVTRVARGPKNQADVDSLRLAIFDVIDVGGVTPAAFEDSWATIQAVFREGVTAHPVLSRSGVTLEALADEVERVIDAEGAEGLMARSDATGIFKIKRRHSVDLVVLGFSEGTEDRADMLHDMLVGVVRSDGAYQVLTKVGGGFSEEDRKKYFSRLGNHVVPSDYAEVNSAHVAYKMVDPHLVIEVSCLDIISLRGRNTPIERMVLNYEDGRWSAVRSMPLASLISPTFLRERGDKKPSPESVSIRQITDLVAVDNADSTVDDLQLPKSSVLKRRVATKDLRGNTGVRKVMLWATNKAAVSDDYPAYVVYSTDFSPNRAEKLKRELRVTNDRDQADGLYREFCERAFKTGWEIHSDSE